MTGPLIRLNINGPIGSLKDYWSAGPLSYLGLAIPNFPNLFTVTGPGSPSVLSNMPVSIEQHVDWITDCISYCMQNDIDKIEADVKAAQDWVLHVREAAEATLLPKAGNSWYWGANIPGKPRVFMPYAGGLVRYRKICDGAAKGGYVGFSFLKRGADKNLDKLDIIIKDHMKRLIETYPQINDWDVYNEPIGPFKPHIPPSAITEWIKMKGGIYPAMVEIYQFVDSVNPNKNYSNNHYHAKDPEFLKINNFFVEKNLNFSSIGMQAHMQTNDNVMSESQLWNQIKEYEGLGKKIQFTEITVTSSERFKNWKEHQAFLKERDEVMSKGGVMNLSLIHI